MKNKTSFIAPMGMASFFFAKEKDIMNSGKLRLKKGSVSALKLKSKDHFCNRKVD